MAFKFISNPYGGDMGYPVSKTAGGTITAGQLVVLSGSADTYTAIGDNAILLSGIANTSAASSGTFELVPLLPGMILEGPYTGSFSAGMIGFQCGIDGSQNIDLANTTQLLFQLVSVDETAVTARVRVLAACCIEFGAAV